VAIVPPVASITSVVPAEAVMVMALTVLAARV
jgi:hypothetical protein